HSACPDHREHDEGDGGEPASPGQSQREIRHRRIERRADRRRFRRHQEAGAAGEEHARQRDDERRHVEDVDNGAHGRAEGGAQQQDCGEGSERRHTKTLDRQRDEHGGEADHRADRQVDAPGNDHEGHAGGDDPEKGVVGQQIGGYPGGSEIGKLHRTECKSDDENNGRDRDRRQPPHWRALPSTAPALAKRGDCSSRTTRTTAAFTTRLNSGGYPDSRMPVFIAWMISAPTIASTRLKRPPNSEVPPITTARMASSSSQSPALLASAPMMSAAAMTPA